MSKRLPTSKWPGGRGIGSRCAASSTVVSSLHFSAVPVCGGDAVGSSRGRDGKVSSARHSAPQAKAGSSLAHPPGIAAWALGARFLRSRRVRAKSASWASRRFTRAAKIRCGSLSEVPLTSGLGARSSRRCLLTQPTPAVQSPRWGRLNLPQCRPSLRKGAVVTRLPRRHRQAALAAREAKDFPVRGNRWPRADDPVPDQGCRRVSPTTHGLCSATDRAPAQHRKGSVTAAIASPPMGRALASTSATIKSFLRDSSGHLHS
jgi:hypothetical protein